MVPKATSDERRSARANVLLGGTIDCGGTRVKVRVGNLSAHGALLIGNKLPPEATAVTFRCNGATISGWVAWVRGTCVGIDFDEAIDPQDVLRNHANPHLAITRDTRTIDFRRPGFRGNQLTLEERRIVEDWAQASGERPGD
jgi:hypothetical protein